MLAAPTPHLPAASGGNSFVKVYVRTRPLLPEECEEGAKNILQVSSADKQVVVEDGSEKTFKYDGVLEEDAGQEDVYSRTVAPLVAKVKQGHNATVFAYGQTGSGKTYTMGTNPCVSKVDEGILQRAMQALLTMGENNPPLDQDTKPFSISRHLTISVMEIYNDTVYDLLTPRHELKIKHEVGGGASAVGMVEETVESVESGLALLEKGSHLRSVGTTAMNNCSSRSHALIFLTLKHGSHKGCLKLVDLAGAEGVGRAQTTGQQFTEGVNINKGLLSLGKVLAALCNASFYVPYRESLLTRLLKNSLEGGSYTAMIACVNPASHNVHETINTLRYAEQARNIKMKPQVLSTIKKSAVKRRCEDVSATPGLWKKRILASEKKPEHNSTISTPGHKPPARKLVPSFNTTFATPLNRASEGFPGNAQSQGFQKPHLPAATTMFPSLNQPIFEDDSFSKLSSVSTIDETKSSPPLSPLVERFTSRLEKTLMTQLESIEDRVADTIISKLTHKTKGRRPRNKPKLLKGNSMCSSPIAQDSSLGTDTDSSDDTLLGTSIVRALFGKNKKIKSVLQEVVSTALQNLPEESSKRGIMSQHHVKQSPSKSSAGRKPFEDLTNVFNRSGTSLSKEENPNNRTVRKVLQQTPAVYTCPDPVLNLPFTSTAVCETRAVRRSTRCSTRLSLHKAMFKDLSPEFKYDDVTVSQNESSTSLLVHDATLRQALNSSPMLGPLNAIKKSGILKESNKTLESSLTAEMDATKCDIGTSPLIQNVVPPPKHTDKKSVPEKFNRRRSSRIEAFNATQKNLKILQDESPEIRKKRRRSSCVTKNVSAVVQANMSVCGNCLSSTIVGKASDVVKVSPRRLKQHRDAVLNKLNNGDLRELQRLATVGPKTAMVIHNFRKLCHKFNSVEDLEEVPGLPKSFYNRFMKANFLTPAQ